MIEREYEICKIRGHVEALSILDAAQAAQKSMQNQYGTGYGFLWKTCRWCGIHFRDETRQVQVELKLTPDKPLDIPDKS